MSSVDIVVEEENEETPTSTASTTACAHARDWATPARPGQDLDLPAARRGLGPRPAPARGVTSAHRAPRDRAPLRHLGGPTRPSSAGARRTGAGSWRTNGFRIRRPPCPGSLTPGCSTRRTERVFDAIHESGALTRGWHGVESVRGELDWPKERRGRRRLPALAEHPPYTVGFDMETTRIDGRHARGVRP